jgi:hypothetical protein
MTCNTSTPYSRDLGDELRRIREKQTKYNGVAMGDFLGWDQSKVSNVENGKARASEIDIVQYLTVCGKDREFVEGFLSRYRNAFDTYFVQVPQNLRTMALAEASASKITSYSMVSIPGLLQTEDYVRAHCAQTGNVADEDVEALIRFRMERQAILRRHDRPECTFFVHEFALRMKVGSDEVMEEQYRRLLFRTHVLRIVPESSGLVGALPATYILWQYEKLAPVAFTESALAKVFVQDPGVIKHCKDTFEQLDGVALSEGQSRSLLTDLVSRPREDRNAPGMRLA